MKFYLALLAIQAARLPSYGGSMDVSTDGGSKLVGGRAADVFGRSREILHRQRERQARSRNRVNTLLGSVMDYGSSLSQDVGRQGSMGGRFSLSGRGAGPRGRGHPSSHGRQQASTDETELDDGASQGSDDAGYDANSEADQSISSGANHKRPHHY